MVGQAVLDDAEVGPLGAGDVLVRVGGEGEEALTHAERCLCAGVGAGQRRDGGGRDGRADLRGKANQNIHTRFK